MPYHDASVAVVPLSYAEEAGEYEGGARVARVLAWVGLAYGLARLGMCGVYVLERWGGSDMSFYPWDVEGWEGLLLASWSGLVNAGLVAASVMTLRLTPLAPGAMLAYAAGAILLWVAELAVQAYYNYTGYYGDLAPLEAAMLTLQDAGYQIGHLTFPVLVLMLMRRPAGFGR